jgi:hypothetical protein
MSESHISAGETVEIRAITTDIKETLGEKLREEKRRGKLSSNG